MSNPPKAKGTKNESRLLEHLQDIWPLAHRTSAGQFSHDITGTPLVIEAKKCKSWRLHEWLGKIRTHEPFRWALFVSDGDNRRSGSVGNVMVVDEAFGLELLECWESLTWTRESVYAYPEKHLEEN